MAQAVRWTRNEVKAVWRALTRVPFAHVANNRELTGISRQTLAERDVAGAGAPTAGVYDEATGRIVLFDAAFDLALTGRSLDRVLLELVGESLWRTYRRGSLITDRGRFGELYARYHLEREALSAEEPVVFGRLSEALSAPLEAVGGREVSWPSWQGRVREAMCEARAGWEGKTWVPGPAPLQRAERTWPLLFVQGVGSLLAPEVVCAVYDTVTGAVHYREPSVFEEVLQALNFPASAPSLDGGTLLTAWLVLSSGEAPSLLTEADGRDMGHPMVRPPSLTRDDRGDWLVDGWTRQEGGLSHHTLRISPSRVVTATVSRH